MTVMTVFLLLPRGVCNAGVAGGLTVPGPLFLQTPKGVEKPS
jgi:hypothetical protein